MAKNHSTVFGDIKTVLEKAAEVGETFDRLWAEKTNPQTRTEKEVHRSLMQQTAKLQALQEQMKFFLPGTESEYSREIGKTWIDIATRINNYTYDDVQKRGERLYMPIVSSYEMDASQKKQEAKSVTSRRIEQGTQNLMQFEYEIENLQAAIGSCGDNDIKEQNQRKVVFLNRMSDEHRFLLRKVEWMTKWLDQDGLDDSDHPSDDFDPDSALSLAYALQSYLEQADKDHRDRVYRNMGLNDIAVGPGEMIGYLPMEILLEVFGVLDGAAHHRMRRVCSSWDGLLSNPLLRKYAFLDLKLLRDIFSGFSTVKDRTASAFEQCLGNRTTHLIMMVGSKKDKYDAEMEDFMEDWLLGPVLKKEYFQKAEHLQCIILHDFSAKLELNMLAASLPDSLEKLVFRNMRVLARVEGSGLFRHTELETFLEMHVIEKKGQWPWGFCIGFDAVQFVGDIMGPLSDDQRVQFADTVSSGQFSLVRQSLMTEMMGMQRSADGGQLLQRFGDLTDPSVVGQYKPWIQQLAFAYMIRYLNEQQRLTERYDSPDNDVEEYYGYDHNDRPSDVDSDGVDDDYWERRCFNYD